MVLKIDKHRVVCPDCGDAHELVEAENIQCECGMFLEFDSIFGQLTAKWVSTEGIETKATLEKVNE